MSWFTELEDERKARPAAPAVAYKTHYDGYFDEPLNYYDADYASTVEPDSDEEPLAEDSDTDYKAESGCANTAVLVTQCLQAEEALHRPAGCDASAPGGCSPACAATQHRYDRRIVEFCCSHESRIGKRAPKGCEVVR